MSLSPERKGRLTASKFASAMGISKYKSIHQLYKDEIGEGKPFNGNEATQHGVEHESNCHESYELDQRVFVDFAGDAQQFIKHPEHDFLGCTPDGRVGDLRLVEFKCPFYGMYDTAPPHYIAQCMGQMGITGLKECDLVAWTHDELKIWRIKFSEEYWQLQLELLQKFWHMVQTRTKPKKWNKETNPQPIMPSVEIEFLL